MRYLAKRAKLHGTTPEEEVKCDMLAEACRDLIIIACQAPFQRYKGGPENPAFGQMHKEFMKDKWALFGSRFEAILQRNGGKFLVGNAMTYADILVAHVLTWFVEECGPEIVENTPLLVDLQALVIELPNVNAFIKGPNYYPVGNEAFVVQCFRVLGRADQIKPVATPASGK